ncbi:hypothetical protein ANCDUO_09251 [Ancylostoma duodenale]|uniref:guanylate cyclase n=1 Tax=Ancylostoma duodenale TaxID=51022 RepID=A0A0C2GTL4_9BILA|nr:hypothetical protein ANCDUO_09251 [Ancylostoma duodenale]
MKQAVHDNINPFLGISFNEKEELLIVWKFCSRGTLQDIVYNENITLDQKFHGAFIRDILAGLEYLHASSIGCHGALSTWSCLIDRNWMIKLTDYGIADPLERWEKQQAINVEALKDSDDKTQATQATSALYEAPELLKNREKNRLRRMDQDWMKQTQSPLLAIHAFARRNVIKLNVSAHKTQDPSMESMVVHDFQTCWASIGCVFCGYRSYPN